MDDYYKTIETLKKQLEETRAQLSSMEITARAHSSQR
jgi:hypothetical protein